MTTTASKAEPTPLTGTLPLVFTVSADWWSAGDPSLSGTTSAPDWLPISGLVTFTPRLPKGFTAYTANFPVAGNVNAVQTISILGSPDGGNWKISYGGYTTASLPFNVTAAVVQSSLQALTSIGTGNVTVTNGQTTFDYIATFAGTLGYQPVALLTADKTNGGSGGLTSSAGNTINITVEMTTPGTTARNANTGVVIPTRQGRIWAGQLASIDVADSPGVELVSNDPNLNLIDQNIASLIYDVTFSQVTYNGGPGTLTNFAFAAPPDTTPINLTNPEFPRLSWQPPGTT